jgi:hypothetical protein
VNTALELLYVGPIWGGMGIRGDPAFCILQSSLCASAIFQCTRVAELLTVSLRGNEAV